MSDMTRTVSRDIRTTVEYDATVDASYQRFSDKPIARTVQVSDGVYEDFAADGSLVGRETLGGYPSAGSDGEDR